MTKNLPAITDDEGELGPAMQALKSPRMREFVRQCNQPAADGTVNYSLAAEKAGYAAESRGALAVTAHRLAHDPRIQAAILEEGIRTLGAGVQVATGVILQVATNPRAKDADRLKAAAMLLDRAGLPARSEHTVNVNKIETPGDKVERIVRLANQLGMDPAALLGQYGVSIEVSDMSDGTAGTLVIDPIVDDFLKEIA